MLEVVIPTKLSKLEETEEHKQWLGYYEKMLAKLHDKSVEEGKRQLEKDSGYDLTKVVVDFEGMTIDMESDYSLMVMCEMSLINYLYVLDFCQKNGIESVVDIGCAIDWQSDIFLKNNIKYEAVDVNISDRNRHYNTSKVEYHEGEYPLNIGEDRNRLGVAILSLGWNCYVGKGDNTLLKKQFNQLSKDFKQSLVYLDKETLQYIKPYFKEVIPLSGNFNLLVSNI